MIEQRKNFDEFIKQVRINILKFSLAAGSDSAHIGGALSCADIMGVLYKKYIKIVESGSDKRNRFILSKGHACLALYSCLVELGLIKPEEIQTFEKNESRLLGHPVINKVLAVLSLSRTKKKKIMFTFYLEMGNVMRGLFGKVL